MTRMAGEGMSTPLTCADLPDVLPRRPAGPLAGERGLLVAEGPEPGGDEHSPEPARHDRRGREGGGPVVPAPRSPGAPDRAPGRDNRPGNEERPRAQPRDQPGAADRPDDDDGRNRDVGLAGAKRGKV